MKPSNVKFREKRVIPETKPRFVCGGVSTTALLTPLVVAGLPHERDPDWSRDGLDGDVVVKVWVAEI